MPEAGTIGSNLKRLRRERGLSQEALAERAGISASTVARLEQGRRLGERTSTLMKLANALDAELSDLTGKRERLGTDRDGGSVLAIRNVILTPTLLPGLPGLDPDDPGDPTPLPQLHHAINTAWTTYWKGDFGPLVAALPGLITEARLTHQTLGTPAARPLAESYQLASGLMELFGKTDLAAIAAERGIQVAAQGDDQLLWAMLQRTYGWVLLNQARAAEAERLAAHVAGEIEPSFSAPAIEVAVWGNVLISALWAASAAGNPTDDYISMIAAGAERVGGRIETYSSSYGPSRAAMHITHAYVLRGETGKAMDAARKVRPAELGRISYGRHLIDLAQAHADQRQFRTAEMRLQEARALAPVWFRHQSSAQQIVADIRQNQPRLTPGIRQLAQALDLNP